MKVEGVGKVRVYVPVNIFCLKMSPLVTTKTDFFHIARSSAKAKKHQIYAQFTKSLQDILD